MKAPAIWLGLIVFLMICLGAGGLGAIATTPEIEGWYKTLEKPAWNPPDWKPVPFPMSKEVISGDC